MSTAADWDIWIRDGAMIITTIVIPFGISAYQKRTGVQVTDQERAAVYNAVDTLKGDLQTQIDTGAIKPADLTPTHPAVAARALTAIQPVSEAAAHQGVTAAHLARLAIARVDTSPKPTAVAFPTLNNNPQRPPS